MTTSAQAAPTAITALATTPSEAIERFDTSARKPEAITLVLRRAAEKCNLVSPATEVEELPEGCTVQTSAVLVTERDTYEIPGDGDGGPKRGLGKVALYKIAAAAGISWDPSASRRVDDRRDPNYVEYVAVGRYRSFDGTIMVLQATKAVDLRPKSPVVEALFERYRARHAKWVAGGKKGYEPKSPEGQIREQRLHILSLAETKARLRAVRVLGIRTSYTAQEILKPFVVARLCFTGATSDPVLRREFAILQAKSMLSSLQGLYGDAGLEAARQLSAAPAIEATPLDSEDLDDGDEADVLPSREEVMARVVESLPVAPTSSPAPNDPAPAFAGAPTPTKQASSEAPAQTTPEAEFEPEAGPVMKFGRSQGQPLADVDDESLSWYANALHRSVDDPSKAKWRASNERDLAAARAEQAARRAAEA